MTVKELKEALKSVSDSTKVKIELPWDPMRSGSDFADAKVRISGSPWDGDTVYIGEA